MTSTATAPSKSQNQTTTTAATAAAPAATAHQQENQRPRTSASETTTMSPTKSRFSLLRYRRYREKVATQHPPPFVGVPEGDVEFGELEGEVEAEYCVFVFVVVFVEFKQLELVGGEQRDEDEAPPRKAEDVRPHKTVRAYVCRHFVSVPVEDLTPPPAPNQAQDPDRESNQHVQQQQQQQQHPTIATAADTPPAEEDPPLSPPPPFLFHGPTAEPTPPPTPPLKPQLQLPQHPPSSPPPTNADTPTFTLTPPSPNPAQTTFRSSTISIPARNSSASSFLAVAGMAAGNAGPQASLPKNGVPACCPTCTALAAAMAHARKTAGIYGPRHSLSTQAAKQARLARVAWANREWEAGNWEWDLEEGERGDEGLRLEAVGLVAGEEEGLGERTQVVRFLERPRIVEDGGGEEADGVPSGPLRAKVWGPLGERNRKSKEFKRSLDSYVPGRWAAGEGVEWLDTSGRRMTYEEYYEGKTEGKHGAVRIVVEFKKWVGGGKKEKERERDRERGIGIDDE
ncbi:uncharacterized protein LTHEOB_12495 [Neofusicoccum parvum]|uniref:Uncharacterized protein LTHEOB_12495 n=1 Tax=Neofusicoccum parvum TaxID=310453 RepID=A0ACB5SQ87_9PEZI|nr:uncharacterized protein LTHEOB_12495 [Neofusicoccum parvum]